jgi:hypothetical protein
MDYFGIDVLSSALASETSSPLTFAIKVLYAAGFIVLSRLDSPGLQRGGTLQNGAFSRVSVSH